MNTVEICANSFTSALAAQNGGAQRVELCENMAEGGTTPSYGTIKLAVDKLNVEVWPIIRPRGGDFLYTDVEFELMKLDIDMAKQLGCAGVVFGILTPNGEIDTLRCKELIAHAHPLPCSFHRAFDMCADQKKSLEILIELGFVRVLSSGAANNAYLGADLLAELVSLSGNRIQIMPGAGINADNILSIKRKTGASNFHASCRAKVSSLMQFRNANSNMGNMDDEYSIEQTSTEMVKLLVETINGYDKN